jgi:hypothetical protein
MAYRHTSSTVRVPSFCSAFANGARWQKPSSPKQQSFTMATSVANHLRTLQGLSRHHNNAVARRFMSANAKVWIDKDTRVICQGFTGKQVLFVSCVETVLELYDMLDLCCHGCSHSLRMVFFVCVTFYST